MHTSGHIRIKFVTVPPSLGGNFANQTSVIEIQDREKVKANKYKDYESEILKPSPREVRGPDHHSWEWP